MKTKYLISALLYSSIGFLLSKNELSFLTIDFWLIFFLIGLIQTHGHLSGVHQTMDLFEDEIKIMKKCESDLVDTTEKLMQLVSSVTSAPADTSPHDAKPPQP